MPNVTHATVLVGIEKNIFQEELGKDISFQPINFIVGNSIVDAFITNQIDLAYVGPGPFINALYRKVPVELLSGAANGGTSIVGTLNETSLRQGMRIAVPQYGNTQDFILHSYLGNINLQDKVKIFAIPPQDTGTAFYTMSIDAACLPEPWGTILIGKDICKELVNEKDILNNGNYPVTLLVVNKKYAKENPDLVKRFLVAHKKANRFISDYPNKAIEIVTKVISTISKKEIDKNVIAISFIKCGFNNDVDLNILNKFKEIGIRAGYYRKGFLVDDFKKLEKSVKNENSTD
ncbi:MAG: ABC transporter substrate-binding protein [Candidatus Melainabacteria bacterium]|nr:ABC transporter substrate-binding protein [Candidatus Melainabacteria bacterium]